MKELFEKQRRQSLLIHAETGVPLNIIHKRMSGVTLSVSDMEEVNKRLHPIRYWISTFFK